MHPSDQRTGRGRDVWLVAAAVVVVLLCWILTAPRHAGPDEPSHAVASAALVRGQRSGPSAGLPYSAQLLEAPAMVGTPNPGCFAFDPTQPAECAGLPVDSTALTEQVARSADYPVWGYLLPGLASFVPSPTWYAYLARMANAALAAGLVVWSIQRARRSENRWTPVALLLALTPIAWFSMSIINPSAMAIAGAVGLWVALLTAGPPGRTDWLLVAGWTALVLPRRDGPLWATAVTLLACAAVGARPRALIPRLGRAGSAIVVLAWLAAFPAVLSQDWSLFDLVLAASPLAIVAVDLAAAPVAQRAGGRRPLLLGAGAAVAATALALAAVNLFRSAGPDSTLTQRVIAATGEHFRQMVGVLGWLDTPAPELARVLFWMATGALFAVGLSRPSRSVWTAMLTLWVAVSLAWVLELGSGNVSGTYWQGRYSVPLVIGVPLLATLRAGDGATESTLRRVVGAATWTVWNLSFAAAMRRWAVGVDGPLNPLRWSIDTAPLPTVPLLVVHAAASALLVIVVSGTMWRSTETPPV